MKKVKRRYDSSHRKIQAGTTKAQIVQAARRLFGELGYAHTTIDQIAAEAGVAVPTIYSTLGGKRAILLKLLDEMEAGGDVSELHSRLAERGRGAEQQLRVFVDFTVRFFSSGSDILRIVELAGASDPDAAALWELGEARRLETCTRVISGWTGRKRLRPGIAEREAVDILWAISGPEVYTLFVRKRGWTPEAFGEWMFQTALSQLLQA